MPFSSRIEQGPNFVPEKGTVSLTSSIFPDREEVPHKVLRPFLCLELLSGRTLKESDGHHRCSWGPDPAERSGWIESVLVRLSLTEDKQMNT